ncbi:MAG: hypothetical protein DHS20C15_17830 [Planctomycetota bacterium]|nr:MAG: hypothetical protein DHS20C15_17830 [Planctomycetota bacterium]
MLLVLAIDALGFGRFAPWEELRERISKADYMEIGVAADRMFFETLRALPEETPSVALLGTSRAGRGLVSYELAQGPLQHVEFLRFCHAGLSPFELHALVSELVETPPDVAVFMLSEFETHRPLRLQTVLGAGSPTALFDLAELAGASFVFEHRDTFLGLTLASALNAYRYRALWASAGLVSWRRFLPAHLDRRRDQLSAPFLMTGEPPLPVNILETRKQLGEVFPLVGASLLRAQLVQLRGITLGPHADLQLELTRRSVEALLAAGSQVLLVEGPIYPPAVTLFAEEPRAQFRRFARELKALPGVEMIWLSESGPFRAPVFGDLTHLDTPGSKQLAVSVRKRLASMLDL